MFVIIQIKFANRNSVPFLAVSGFHGSISTLGNFQDGIEILLTKLNGVKIASDGKSATIGGGIRSKDLTDTLWAAGKQTGEFLHHPFTSPFR